MVSTITNECTGLDIKAKAFEVKKTFDIKATNVKMQSPIFSFLSFFSFAFDDWIAKMQFRR